LYRCHGGVPVRPYGAGLKAPMVNNRLEPVTIEPAHKTVYRHRFHPRMASRPLLETLRQRFRQYGYAQTVRSVAVWLLSPAWHYGHRTTKCPRWFRFRGRKYIYFTHNHNETYANERTVEVPIVWRMVQRYRGQRILEVGNVLGRYFPFRHDCVDKYEIAPGVINEDITVLSSSRRYDLIISISTLEHVGWDEVPREPAKALRAVENMVRHLAPGGVLLMTIPLGYNHRLDEWLRDHTLSFTRRSYLRRISATNEWHECEWTEVANARYGEPFPCANGLVIASLRRPR
jgi:hypothetical protein